MRVMRRIARFIDTNFRRGKVTSFKVEFEGCGHVEYVKPRPAGKGSQRPEKAACRECELAMANDQSKR